MSLVCHEDGSQLRIANEAFCATIETAERYAAICDAHIAIIPENERIPERIDGGLDIHSLFGTPNGISSDPFTNTISAYNGELVFGDYRFSLRPEVARLLLPRACELYLK